MPIDISTRTKRIEQREFQQIAYDVMGEVFAIHREFGRFFDEMIYKQELAARMADAQLEVAIKVTHEAFSKTYFADLLVTGGGLFEFKASEGIHPRHIAQTTNYLLLLDLAHAKVTNVRPQRVESCFVNCKKRLHQLRRPAVDSHDFEMSMPGAKQFRHQLMSLVADWGTALQLPVYTEALVHFFDGETVACKDVTVFGSNGAIGQQKMNFAAPGVAFKLTAITGRTTDFANHAQRLIDRTSLKALFWANLADGCVRFATPHNRNAKQDDFMAMQVSDSK